MDRLADGSQRGRVNLSGGTAPAPNLQLAAPNVSVNVGGNAVNLSPDKLTTGYIDPTANL
ncbi:MAG TPA: hypothetical protein VG602_00200 [Actinomycetota bacterium]|nr:hypothetical protein [Actinomycetota bacterium]